MSIVLDRLSKRYGSQYVVADVSLEIADGELFVMLGASGSGKSTILRLIAGLALPDGGRILLHGRDVTTLPPQARNTGFVFQNYSIFRHMTVARNVEFGLRIRKVPAPERARKAEELLDMVGLSGLGDRYADQLSGGQQQRVALARALAYEPSVLLLDEPLGALDVKIRAQLRRSLKQIQRRLGVTTILVTHDQEEAFELGDRIGVIDRGVLLEVGQPEQLYERPRSLFVASFLGAGTVLVGRVAGGQARFGHLRLPVPDDVPHEEDASVKLLFRPEHVELAAERPDGPAVLGQGEIVEQTFNGALRRLRLRLPRLAATRQVSPLVPFGEDGLLVDAVVAADADLRVSAPWVSVRRWSILETSPAHLLAFDPGVGPTAALELAGKLAERMHASLSVLGVTPEADGVEQLGSALRRRAGEAGLERRELHVRAGEIVDQIITQCIGSLVETIIVPEQLEPAGRAAVAPEVLDLLERARLPVLVVPAEAPEVDRVLICTRTGEPAKSDIRAGGRLARRLGVPATLLHITCDGDTPSARARVFLDQASASLDALEVDNDIRTCQNPDATEGILQEARPNDVIVLGGHGPSPPSVFSPDDITTRVLSRSRRPVLVIPMEES